MSPTSVININVDKYAFMKLLKGLISDIEWGKQNYVDVLSGALAIQNLPDLEFISFHERIPDNFSSNKRVFSFDNFFDGADSSHVNQVEDIIRRSSEHDVCNIQFTSGTTGNPKGACLTHHNVINNTVVSGARLGTTEKDTMLVNVPLYHCFGCVGASLAMAVQ